MLITDIKRKASDCRKTHRWAEVRSDFDVLATTVYRIIGVGREKVRVMSNAGTIFYVKPADIKRAW